MSHGRPGDVAVFGAPVVWRAEGYFMMDFSLRSYERLILKNDLAYAVAFFSNIYAFRGMHNRLAGKVEVYGF